MNALVKHDWALRTAGRIFGVSLLVLCMGVGVAFAATNTPPTITSIDDQIIDEDTDTGLLSFTVGDNENNASQLFIFKSSSDTTLIPNANITVSGNTAAKQVRVAPATNEFGSADITLVVTDLGGLSTTNIFTVTVHSVNDAPTVALVPLQTTTTDEDTPKTLNFTINDVEDDNTTLTFDASSDDQTLLPDARISTGGSGSSRSITCWPATNDNGQVSITVSVTDSSNSVGSISFDLTVTPVNDDPVLTGNVDVLIPDNIGSTKLYSGLSVTDPDDNRPNPETIDLTVNIGENVVIGEFDGIAGSSVTYSGTPAYVSGRLQDLIFAPFENRVAVSNTESFSVSITVEDSAHATVPYSSDVTVVSMNDLPLLTASVSPAVILDTETVYPFSVSVSDPDVGESFSASMSVSNDPSGTFGSLTPFPATASGNAISVQSAVQSFGYIPAVNVITGSQDIVFAFSVTDTYGGRSTATASLTVNEVNEPPTIHGISTSLIRTDDATRVTPFADAYFSDPDRNGAELLTVTVSVSNPSYGQMSAVSNVADVAAANLWLQSLEFIPDANNIPVGQTEVVALTVTVSDSANNSRYDDQTEVAITGVNGAPEFYPAQIPPVRYIKPADPRPFDGMYVEDDSTNNLTLTIVLDNYDKGELVSTNTGFFEPTPGTYVFTNTQVAISNLLNSLEFDMNESYPFAADAPGDTTFTLTAEDPQENSGTATVRVILQAELQNFLVTHSTDDNSEGSLRYALSQATSGDCITFALPEYPALIRLQETNGTVTLSRHVVLKGPGADLLRLSGDSDGDGTADMQLFDVQATVVMEGLTLESGTGLNGGAVSVDEGASLTMKSCVVKNSTAQFWGGAIDVFDGALHLDRCLILSNSTDFALGAGGGGISLYTDQDCSFENTTFSENRQGASAGYGGGALFIENSNPQTYLTVDVTHCTFAENSDAAGEVSAVSVNSQGAVLNTLNTVYADGDIRNLMIYGGGDVVSFGGNLSDDSTFVLSSQSGQADSVYLLDQGTDLTSVTNINLGDLTVAGATRVYPLMPGSAAIGQAESSAVGVDQVGMIRDADPDSGAADAGASTRLVINEIQSNDFPDDFIELYVPRDSLAVTLDGFELFVDDTLRHVFTNQTILPGLGIVVSDSAVDASGTTVVTSSTAPLDLNGQGLIQIKNPAGLVVVQVEFVDAFPELSSAIKENASLTLTPQFAGAAYLPSTKVQAPPYGGWDATAGDNAKSTPGLDSVGTPFGSDNAAPVAGDDIIELSEDMLTVIPVLSNDQDSDRTDSVVVTGVPTNTSSVSASGAAYWVGTNTVTGYGNAVVYDPRVSTNFNKLPDGVEAFDTLTYRISDVGEGTIVSFASAAGGVTVAAEGHRMTGGEQVQIYGTSNYDGIYTVSNATDNAFVIAAEYAGDETTGSWISRSSRGGLAEATVSITVIGANDYPVAGADSVSCGEEDILRILADPDSGVIFDDSEYSPVSVTLAPSNLLQNDDDVDTDDDSGSLLVVGVLDRVIAIDSFSGTVGSSPVTVHCEDHGLSTGESIVISRYGGHPSYNGEQVVMVVDADSFTIPALYVDNAAEKGVWGRLNDGSRLSAVSELGAAVTLDIRVDREETHIIYNPRVSDTLNAISLGSNRVDTFYYAVADSHDAVSIGQVSVTVTGENELSEVGADPESLSVLDPFIGTGALSDVLRGITVVDAAGAESGTSGRADVRVYADSSDETNSVVLTDVWTVKETEVLDILCADLLSNDSDEDTDDILLVSSVFDSDQGVDVTLFTSNILYDASASPVMNTLAQGEFALDFFRAVVADGHDGFVTNVVAVLVEGVNDTPVSFDDRITLKEDATPFSFDPRSGTYATTNDYDVDINGSAPDNSLWVLPQERTMSPREGFYTITNDTVTYEPALSTNYLNMLPGTSTNYLDGIPFGKTLTDYFDYTVSDQSFIFAENDLFRVEADGSGFVFEVLSNDRNYNVRGGELQISAVGVPDSRGTVSITGGGTTLTYTPEVNFVGDETFTYTVTDPWGNIDKARVTARVTTELFNGALQANNDAFSAALGESVTLDVLGNDNTLPNSGNNLTITRLLTDEDQDHIQLVDNEIQYVQTNDTVSTETFRYEIAGSASGTARAIAEVTVRIVDRTSKLPVQDDFFTLPINSVGMQLDVTRNDFILPVSRELEILSIDSIPQGTVSNDTATGTLIYTARSGFVGRDIFGYTVSDGLGGTGSGRITVYVGLPLAEGDVFTVPNDSGTYALDVLANDRVLPGSAGTLTLSTSAAPGTNGSVAVTAGQLRFAGNGVAGESVFTYTVSDGTRSVQSSVRVLTVPDGVYANADTFRVLSDSQAVTLNVLNNDSSLPSGNSLSISAIGTGTDAPDHGGTVLRSADNKSLVYTPAEGFVGEESFTYTMTDSQYSNEARVTVKVGTPRFVAGDDCFAVYHEGAETGTFTLPILLNDVFLPDQGGLLQVVGVGLDGNEPDAGGTVDISPDGQNLIYQPSTNYTGSASYMESFTYEVSDGTDQRDEGWVEVTVYPRNEGRVPECNADMYSVARESTGNVLHVLENDGVLPDVASLWTITSVGPATFGGAVSVSGSTVVYTPDPDFVGTDTFEYEINDGLGSIKSAVVSVRVGSLLLNADEFVVESGTVSNEFDVLLNDGILPGPEFDLLLNTNAASAAIGTVVSTTDRLFYTPSTNYAGAYPYEDTVLYGVIDDSGITRTGSVTVTVVEEDSDLSTSTVIFTVEGVNDAPVMHQFGQLLQTTDKDPIVAFPDSYIIDVDEWGEELLTVNIQLDDAVKGQLTSLGGFVDLGSGVYEIEGVTPTNATLALQGLVFEPTENRIPITNVSEITTFTVRTWDPFVTNAVVATQQVNVVSVDDTPKPQQDRYRTDEDTPIDLYADRLSGETNISLLAGGSSADWDPDIDDVAENMFVKGVFLDVHPISTYAQSGSNAVLVTSAAHGLTTGTEILIAGYGGYSIHDRYSRDYTYNSTQAVTVVDADTFTIPISYVDNDAEKGAWALLSDALSATARSAGDALLTFDAGADRSQTRIVYDPTESEFLQTLAVTNDQPAIPGFTNYVDRFYYTMADKQGRLSFQLVSVDVDPVNDEPVLSDDPTGLQQLLGLTNAVTSLPDVIGDLSVLYARPGTRADWSDVGVEPAGTNLHIQIDDMWSIDEDSLLSIPSVDLMDNDYDVDSNEIYRVSWVMPVSRRSVAVTLRGDGSTVSYDAASAETMKILSRGEMVVDSFDIAVSDDNGAVVTNTVAVLVTGVNDKPVSIADQTSTDEDTLITFDPIHWPTNNPLVWDSDVDINGTLPDDELWLVTVSNKPSAFGAAVSMGDGEITYNPEPSAFLRGLPVGTATNDTFTYTVVDQSSLFADDDEFVVDPAAGAQVLDVLANDRNLSVRGGSFVITNVTTCSAGGSVSISSNGTDVIYTSGMTIETEELFAYTVMDEWGNVDSARVVVRRAGISDALAADYFTVWSDETAVVLNVLLNDGATVSSISNVSAAAQGGTAVVSGTEILFTPSAAYAGAYPYVETFSYISDTLQTGVVEVTVMEAESDASTSLVTITVDGVNDAPVLDYFGQQLQTDDKTPIVAFSTNVVTEYDEWGAEQLTAIITIDKPEKGQLTSLGIFAVVAPGIYQASGTGAEITSALQGLIYSPVADRIPVGSSEVVRFTLDVTDPYIAAPVSGWMEIDVSAVNDTPVIFGTQAGQSVYHALRIKPFSSVTIDEVDDLTIQPLTVQVALDDETHGFLSSLGEFSDLGGGVYSASGISAAAATEALRSMIFEPTAADRLSISNLTETTRFTITVDDAVAPPVVDSNTTVTAFFALSQVVNSPWDSTGNPEEYGMAVGTTRDIIAVGSPEAETNGVVILYERNLGGADAWGELLRIASPDATGGDEFGSAVAMNGDMLVIGAPAHNGTGAAYIYQQNQGGSNSWGFVSKLLADDAASGHQFGGAVAIDGDTAAVGAILASVTASSSGGVYLFGRDEGGVDQWGQYQQVGPGDSTGTKLFGFSVALHGDVLVAGAPFDSDIARNTGAAYVFERSSETNSWVQTQKLFGDPEGTDDQFGYSVDVYEDVIAVGSPQDSAGISGYGAAFVFSKRGTAPEAWLLDRKLQKTSRVEGDLFGDALSLDRDILAVGVRGFGDGVNIGEVHVYGRNEDGADQWGKIELLQSPDGHLNGAFGSALALDQYTLAVCSPGGRLLQEYPGTLNVFRLKYNDTPFVATAIGSQTAYVSIPFSLTVPSRTFADSDVEDFLTFSAEQGDGSALSSTWLSFDPDTRIFSGTPAVTGALQVALIATDIDGESATNSFTVTVVSTNAILPMTQWKSDHFGAAAAADPDAIGQIWSDDADSDGDGLSNLQEYIFGSDPTRAGYLPLHEMVLVYDASVDQLSVSYTRRINDPGLDYVLEVSSDLISWADATSSLSGEVAVPLTDEVERVIAIYDGDGSCLFFRVRVTR